MNVLNILDDNIKDLFINDSLEIQMISKNEQFDVNSLKIKVLKNTSLEINYEVINENKLDIFIHLLDNVTLDLVEIKKGVKAKIQYKYYLDTNSKLNVNKFYHVKGIKEMTVINLNGEGANINYNFKTLANNNEKYDIVIYHNDKKTISNIKNNGVNILDGEITFNISSFVLKNKKECILNQNTRIINLTDNVCSINPNLYIDEYDVQASHSALIGKFNDEEIFYLQRLGINENECLKLLINGFLLSNLNVRKEKLKEIQGIITKYWR